MHDAVPIDSRAERRRLTLLDCVGIGINGIVGSGIFLLPVRVYLAAGGLSWAAWVVVGAVCLLVAFCFAEVASMTTRSGGPYAYAREAFGDGPGFLVGWMALASTLLGYSAVARGLGRNLGYLYAPLAEPGPQAALAWAVILGLGLLNWLGIKPGAHASNFFSAVKLLPLLAFTAAGLIAADYTRLSAPAPSGEGVLRSLQLASVAGLFACTGFEYVPVPAGETRDPQRSVPLALLGSLAFSTLLYVAVQIVLIGTHPDLAHAQAPLAEAARHFSGPLFAAALSLGAALSSFGFCTGSALVGPRYFAALAEDGLLPRLLAQTGARFGTPGPAILTVSLLAGLLCTFLDFDRLADISVVALYFQYVPTCLAVLRLRKTRPQAQRLYRLPGGPAIPLCATLGCCVFFAGTSRGDLVLSAWVLAAGCAFYLVRRRAFLGFR
jgi:basic amino acid/polyamine antiporter, APA family